MEHSRNMAMTLTIPADLAARLKAFAEAEGRDIESYAIDILHLTSDEDWGYTDDDAYWRELRAQADNTLREGSIPFEDVQRWVASWDTENELPPPESKVKARG
ncbi:MAG: antitoxin [Caulobacter sp.]|nr:antitoxin [Caulobacter sp.]